MPMRAGGEIGKIFLQAKSSSYTVSTCKYDQSGYDILDIIIKHVHIPMWRMAVHRFDLLSHRTEFLGGIIPIGDIVDVCLLLV